MASSMTRFARGVRPTSPTTGAVAAADDEFHGRTNLGELDVHVLEHARGYTFALTDEAEQQMLGADVVVVEPLRFVLSKCQDLPRTVRELVEAIHMTGGLFPFSACRALWRILAVLRCAPTPLRSCRPRTDGRLGVVRILSRSGLPAPPHDGAESLKKSQPV